jgi:hypothetical protein
MIDAVYFFIPRETSLYFQIFSAGETHPTRGPRLLSYRIIRLKRNFPGAGREVLDLPVHGWNRSPDTPLSQHYLSSGSLFLKVKDKGPVFTTNPRFIYK